jgi:zinc transport system ATP-binding protein
MKPMPDILTVKDLAVTLNGNPVLKNLSFSIAAGDALAVIGPNGSGKTVLLKALLGLLPHRGTITWASGAKVGYVPQKIDADRHLPMNARDLIEAKARILHLPHAAAIATAKSVGLTPDALQTPVGHLSGGMFQKALIAFALLGDPNVILFDEPTASLDELSEEHVYDLIHNLQDSRGITTILVSHDLSVVYKYASHVLCVNRDLVCFGAPEEALTPEVLDKLYATPHKYYHHFYHGAEAAKDKSR